MRSRGEFALALVLQLLGAGGVLLVATREWQTIVADRPLPFGDYTLGVSGRTVDAAPTALALVALAGVVAVLATRGVLRRLIGAIVALAGAALVWRSTTAMTAVGPARARTLVRPRVNLVSSVAPHVSTHPVWAILSLAGGVLVFVAGLLVLARGAHWAGMSAKYEAPAGRSDGDPEQERQRADASLWRALDRGEDPTKPG